MAFQPNSGRCPPEAAGRRVHVRLCGGYESRSDNPAGWPADGPNGCRWTISRPPHPFDIQAYEVI